MKRREESTDSHAPRGATAASRRRFLKLVATGAAAVAASGSLAPRARAAERTSARSKPARATRTAAVEAEIKSQKDYTAKSLKTLRDFELPPGSEIAFAFRPMKAAKSRGKRGAS